MRDSRDVTIRVGFGDSFKELTVRLPEGDIPPYDPDQKLSVVGRDHDRVDGVAKVTGRARYTYDVQPEGLLHGRILRSPYPNADIKSVDLARARALPGVKAAISFPEVFRQRSIRFAWDGVAAVAAETEAQAEAAVRAIVVEYESLPFAVTTDAARQPGAPRVGRGDQENVQRASPRIPRQRGGAIDEEREKQVQAEMAAREKEVESILAGCDEVVKGTFTTEVQTHASLETHGVVCWWESEKLICHCSTQATFFVRRQLMAPTGEVGASDVEVRCEYMGGGFGSKFFAGREGVAGALLAKEAGRPVKMMLDRREEHTSTGNRPDSIQELTLGVNRDGQVQALRVRGWGTGGTTTGGAGARNNAIYQLGKVDKVEWGVRTNTGDPRPQRAPGWPQGLFALEGAMDMAAVELGLDPIEFRKKNDRHPIRTVEYDIAREKIGWDQKRKRGKGTGAIRTGVGVAATEWHARGGGGATALVRIHRNGRVEVRNGAQDIGTGARTIMGMVVAEELGLPLAAVETFIGNTNDPRGPGSGGSTTTPTLLPAARLAGYRAKEKLLGIVAEEYGWTGTDLDLKNEQVVRRDGAPLGRAVSFRQACALLDEDQIDVLADRPTVGRRQPNYDGFYGTNAGVQAAEVEVDTETGEVRVKKVVAVSDCGKVINPKTATSQVRGGVIQGVSYALFEQRVMDHQKGHMLNADLESYKIAGPVDCPEIDVVFVDCYMGHNNSHVMGLGEPPVIPTAAAIANAVYDACGARITSLPITPDKVLAALARKEAK